MLLCSLLSLTIAALLPALFYCNSPTLPTRNLVLKGYSVFPPIPHHYATTTTYFPNLPFPFWWTFLLYHPVHVCMHFTLFCISQDMIPTTMLLPLIWVNRGCLLPAPVPASRLFYYDTTRYLPLCFLFLLEYLGSTTTVGSVPAILQFCVFGALCMPTCPHALHTACCLMPAAACYLHACQIPPFCTTCTYHLLPFLYPLFYPQ